MYINYFDLILLINTVIKDATNEIKRYAAEYITKSISPISNNIQHDSRNTTEDIMGINHRFFIDIPLFIPNIAENIGLTVKNIIKHSAIPASLGTSVIDINGSKNIIIKIETKVIIFFFIKISTKKLRHNRSFSYIISERNTFLFLYRRSVHE